MKATIGITAGDPAGVGLEVTLKALPDVLESAGWVLFADRRDFERSYPIWGAGLEYRWVANASQISDAPVLSVVDVGAPGSPSSKWGAWTAESGQSALRCLEAAGRAALGREIAAIVTAPVSKEAIGPDFVGQTEWFARSAGRDRFAMAFFAPTLKVVLATIHVALKDALDKISTELYVDLIRLVDSEMRRFQFPSARIAVAAINPHAGEGGMFGREDIALLKPAVEICQAAGIHVTGPHSADSLYYRASTGEFDVVIAPYHDQGLIPVKLIAHGESTNVTLGLPYVRTSPDHGPAFAIAGQGVADAAGMRAALRCAVDLVERTSR